MHSSRIRTGRSLTVCRRLLPRGGGGVCSRGVSAWGGACSREGVSSGGCLLHCRGCLLSGGVCSWGVSALGGCLLLGGVCLGGVCSRGVSAPGGCLLLGVSALGGVCSQGVHSREVSASGGCLLWGGVCSWWGCLLPGGCLLWAGCLPQCMLGYHTPGADNPPVNRMTNRCKNITLATTSLRLVTRMHSSGMHTAHLLPISPSMHCSRRCTCLGGVPAQGGVLVQGVYLPGGYLPSGNLPGCVPARGCTCWWVYLPGGVHAWGVYPPGGDVQVLPLPPADRQTRVKT